MSAIASTRRYYLLKAQAACASGDDALELVWRGKQEAEPGTALPDDFPSRATLAAAHYTTVEDLNGADTCELRMIGISSRDADKIFAALASLL